VVSPPALVPVIAKRSFASQNAPSQSPVRHDVSSPDVLRVLRSTSAGADYSPRVSSTVRSSIVALNFVSGSMKRVESGDQIANSRRRRASSQRMRS